MSQSAISLRAITKRYGDTEVCRDIGLDIAEGEFVTLLGSSGCGKTTTLNMIAGLDEPTSGDIIMAGRRVNGLAPTERDVAMVFQNYALYPHMTVAENIGFSLRLKGLSRGEVRARVQPIAEQLKLGHVISHYPAQLSGGQQQRVAIGRAIIRSPKIFLFDEPFSNLDATLRLKMRAEIKELHARLGVTSVFVTHDQEEAMSISDRIAVMRTGVIEQFGTPEEIYARPESTYVASFIGSPQVDLLPARYEAGVMIVGDARLALPEPMRSMLASHPGEIVIAIRPEHVRMEAGGIPARVRLAQPIGPATLVSFDWPGGMISARLAGLHRLLPGTPANLAFELDQIMFFDHQTGRRLKEY